MQEKVDSADKATELAVAFLEKHYYYVKPVKAVREEDIWTVEVDVGLLSVQIAKVSIDANKSSIIQYSIPATGTTAMPVELP